MRSRSALALAVVLGLGLLLAIFPARYALSVERAVLPADGRSTTRLHLVAEDVFGLRLPWTKEVRSNLQISGDSLGAALLYSHDGSATLRSGTRAGTITLAGAQLQGTIELRLDPRDADRDGLPDAAELISREDRAAFTSWFTAIAESQALAFDDAWAPIHRDCAGLVRFAFKEALRAHDRAWLAKRKRLVASDAPDVRGLRYPELPFLGDRPFRAVPGAFDPRVPIEEAFSAAPSAEILWRLGTVFVSRDLKDAQPGDLLFFTVPSAADSRMHTMIVLGARPGATFEEPGARVVYHTGYDGQVKRVSFTELLAHPDPSWHPEAHNPRFLGVHRLAQLDHSSARPDLVGFAEKAP